jgi:hypothetical protein
LRDHNTVVKEIHNYAERISPHLVQYLEYLGQTAATGPDGDGDGNVNGQGGEDNRVSTLPSPKKPAPLDFALREVITRLKPYGLTKGEVLMLLNVGIGYLGTEAEGDGEKGPADREQEREGEEEGEEEDDQQAALRDAAVVVDTQIHRGNRGKVNDGNSVQSSEGEVNEDGDRDIAGAEEAEEDSGVDGIVRSTIEKCSERLSDDDISAIVSILREIFGPNQRR